MENNAAVIVDSLLNKFGTTIDKLLPSIIEFGRYDCLLNIRVCSYLIVVGIIFVALSWFLTTRYDLSDWLEIISIFLGVFAVIMIIVCAIIIVIEIATLNEWNAFPEIMAYKYILNCVN